MQAIMELEELIASFEKVVTSSDQAKDLLQFKKCLGLNKLD